MAGSFSSIWKGSQIDKAIGVIINSGVTSGEISVLKSVVAGVVDASKAIVVDAQKNIGTFNEIGSNIFKGKYIKFQELTEDPTDNPPAGYQYFYLKSGDFYLKNSSGVVKKVGGGERKEFNFTNATSVVCTHNLKYKYPLVTIVGSDGRPLVGQINYTSIDETLVSFNNAQSGIVIIRLV